MEIFSLPPARFRIFRLASDGKPQTCVAEYDTITKAKRHKWPIEGRFAIEVDGEMMSVAEFARWVRAQEQ